jgi:hypothetical protein
MKKTLLTMAISVLLLTACNNDKKADDTKKDGTTSETARTEGDAKKEEMAPPDSATMMKNWQAYSTPGDVHKMMAKWDGTWAGEMTSWMMEGAPPEKAKLTTVNKMVMNGLGQENTHTGTVMGMAFNGKGTTVYDNHRKEFISSWVDNMGSGMMIMRGTWDDATKTLNMKGKATDPATTGEVDMREVFKVIDDNNHLLEMYTTHAGKEFKSMEIKFTRKK